jgi:hypothetical protein
MKYIAILFILFPMLVLASQPQEKCNPKCGPNETCLQTKQGPWQCAAKAALPSTKLPGKDTGKTSETSPNASGYATKDCENKCTKDQQCTLSTDDERYYCNNLKGTSDKTPRPLEVYISCKTIGGLFKSQCSSNEIIVSAISGKTEIPIREYKPGQCCILKSKLKVH